MPDLYVTGDGATGVLVLSGSSDLVTHPDAGHRILLPGESAPARSHLVHGGNADADAALGRTAWPLIRELIR